MAERRGLIRARLSPRAAVWLRSWRAGLVSLDDCVQELTSGDLSGVEQVVTSASSSDDTHELTEGFAALAAVAQEQVRVVLPVPGDARGLPIGGEFTAEAFTHGEGIIAGERGIVPVRSSHTSGSGDTWDTVEWQMFDIPQPPVTAEPVSVAEADMALSQAVREAADTLTELDVASWNSDLGAALQASRAPAERALPRGFDSRARRLYARAMTLESALRVAETDAMGGAVNAFEASGRAAALRPLAASCREAITAVCHARLSC